MPNSKALLIGINYPGSQYELQGCVNDALTMKDIVINNLGFAPSDVVTLLDSQATTQAILDKLHWLIDGAQPGDRLFLHYSGHGSQIPDDDDTDAEADRLDEIICPVDIDWDTKIIKDDKLRKLFDSVPPGVNLTILFDCCHSGGGLDQVNEHVPSLPTGSRSIRKDIRARYMPMPEKFKARTRALPIPNRPTRQERTVQEVGMLICAARDFQTAADASFGGKPMGAATYYMSNILKETNFKIHYRDLVDQMYARLHKGGFEQQPELNGAGVLMDKEFLAPLGKTDGVGGPGTVAPPPTPAPVKKLNLLEKIIQAIKKFFADLF